MAYEIPEVPNFEDTPEKAVFERHVKMLVASSYTSGIGCTSEMDDCRKAHNANPEVYPNIDEWFIPTENEIDTAISEVQRKGYRIEWRYNSKGRAGQLAVIR